MALYPRYMLPSLCGIDRVFFGCVFRVRFGWVMGSSAYSAFPRQRSAQASSYTAQHRQGVQYSSCMLQSALHRRLGARQIPSTDVFEALRS